MTTTLAPLWLQRGAQVAALSNALAALALIMRYDLTRRSHFGLMFHVLIMAVSVVCFCGLTWVIRERMRLGI